MERLIFFLPLERIKERYSDQWFRWFTRDFKKLKGIKIITVPKRPQTQRIRHGEWLDVYGTNMFKAVQTAMLVRLLQRFYGASTLKNPITVFFMDLWHPGLTALLYIRDNIPYPMKIKGILHAGSYSPGDMLNRNCEEWCIPQERAWFNQVDEIFVGSKWHKDYLSDVVTDQDKVMVVKFPVYTNDRLRNNTPKEDIVVFPNRFDPERQHGNFKIMESTFLMKYPKDRHVKFLCSHEVCKTKGEYYKLLARAKVVVTCPMNENFGIAVKEAQNLGAWAVVPNKFAYKENSAVKYDTLDEAIKLVHTCLHNKLKPPMSGFTSDTMDIIRRI